MTINSNVKIKTKKVLKDVNLGKEEVYSVYYRGKENKMRIGVEDGSFIDIEGDFVVTRTEEK